MTIDEALNELNDVVEDQKYDKGVHQLSTGLVKAIRVVIEELKQEPVLDKIKAEINKPVIRDKYSQRQNDYCDGYEFVCNRIKEIISDMENVNKDDTYDTEPMSKDEIVDSLKIMIFGAQAIERFTAKERKTLDEAINCLNCKEFENCPCGKDGHKSGTSQGYSIGECKDFESQESEGDK